MRKGIGIGCIIAGMLCLFSSLGLIVYNRYESRNVERHSMTLLLDVQEKMAEIDLEQESQKVETPITHEKQNYEMKTVPAGDYDSIGVLTIPVLALELPVLTDWSYEKLKQAPCCYYYGSCYEPDFVIAAHNYPAHFGNLSKLQAGDVVLFTDVSGTVHCYEVILLETLSASATEEMISSGFDLSLYTCTPGGSNRVTVRCNRVDG